ncbi:hypothetical protein INT47_006462 [Mucor saturninus]|uniref:Uncharacterized protein n=1 Tax=Mucor saturninus TaxID=64648 RepID=A0A8H7QP26_9FUNG|nr:hypothetical protein INT47_006462 [Mucor saturninus]
MDSDGSLSGTPGTPGRNMSTSSFLAPSDRILLMVLVGTQSDYIFLRAILEDENFDIRQFINRDFFEEVWLKLTRYARGRSGGRTTATPAFIDTYLDDYLEATDFFPPDFCYGQQTSLIEGAKIFTAY